MLFFPAVCDLLIVLRETEEKSTIQIHAVNLRWLQRGTLFDILK